jgi:hypothetical protein
MAGIVQQLRECRNAAKTKTPTKKRGREGEPGHAFCQREETFAGPRNGKRVQMRAVLHSGQPAEILVESQIV